MEWTNNHDFAVFTHSLDFCTLLPATQTERPSIIQIRAQDVLPESLVDRLVQLLRHFEPMLEAGALITEYEIKAKVRILPVN